MIVLREDGTPEPPRIRDNVDLDAYVDELLEHFRPPGYRDPPPDGDPRPPGDPERIGQGQED